MVDKLSPPPARVARYSGAARLNHWFTAICLILLAISGLAFLFPPLFFMTGLFGGGENARALHPIIGVLMFISFSGLFFRFWRENIWNSTDTQWIMDFKDVILGRDNKLPPIGKYNAGQKFLFWAMSLLILGLFVTGLLSWDEYFFKFTSIETKRFLILGHSMLALAMIALWLGHIYFGIWEKGSMSAMTRGSVTAGWAHRHHILWLKQVAAEDAQKSKPASPSK